MDDVEVKEEVTTVRETPQQVVKTTKVVNPGVQTEHPQKVFNKKKTIFRFHQIIWYILIFIEVLIIIRTVLKVIGANPASGFVSLIYGITDLLVLPFQGIIATSVSGNSIIEWSVMFAAIIYLLIAWGLVYLLQFIKPVTPKEVEAQVD